MNANKLIRLVRTHPDIAHIIHTRILLKSYTPPLCPTNQTPATRRSRLSVKVVSPSNYFPTNWFSPCNASLRPAVLPNDDAKRVQYITRSQYLVGALLKLLPGTLTRERQQFLTHPTLQKSDANPIPKTNIPDSLKDTKRPQSIGRFLFLFKKTAPKSPTNKVSPCNNHNKVPFPKADSFRLVLPLIITNHWSFHASHLQTPLTHSRNTLQSLSQSLNTGELTYPTRPNE